MGGTSLSPGQLAGLAGRFAGSAARTLKAPSPNEGWRGMLASLKSMSSSWSWGTSDGSWSGGGSSGGGGIDGSIRFDEVTAEAQVIEDATLEPAP